MDPKEVVGILTTMIVNSAKFGQQVTESIGNRSMNALNVIEDVLILQLGGPGDDSGLIAALQAAAGVPTQGASTNPRV